MLSLKRLVNCVVYVLAYFARAVFVSVPFRAISAMANFVGAGNAISNSGDSESSFFRKPFGTNDNDSESMDSHDSDSDESFTCEYDSTWDEEVDTSIVTRTRTKKKKFTWHGRSSWSDRRNTNAARDMQIYRHDYPDVEDPPPCQIFPHHPNLRFYRNEINSQPDNVSITEFHVEWWGKYTRLERVHTFIQWLFPIREDGVNFQAYKLTKDEIKAFKADELAKKNLRESYELMLDFYGIKLVDHKTGEVQRAENWVDQFDNLNKYTHNNLRITRILKCLGTLGFTHYQAPLVRFFLKETLENGQLWNVKKSALDYFLFSVLDKEQRKELIKEAFVMFQKSQGAGRGREKFVWCPKWVQKRFKEELNSEQTGTNRTNQSLGSVDENTEGVLVEQNRPQLEKEEGSSEDMKYSDESDETSGSKGDSEEYKNTQVAGDDVAVQTDIDEQQGQSANKPTAMATNDSSVSACSIKPPQLESDNVQHCTNQVDFQDETSPDHTTVSQDKLKGSLALGNQNVGPTGGPTDPPGKAEEIKDDQKQKDYTKDKFGDLSVENTQSGAEHSYPVSACSTKPQQLESDNVQHCTNQADFHIAMQDETSPDHTTVSQDKLKGSLALGNQNVGPTEGPTDPPGKAEEIRDDQKQKDYTKDKFGDLSVENIQSGAEHSYPVSACSTKPQQLESDNVQHCTNQADFHIAMQDETSPDLTTVSQDKLKCSLALGNQNVGPTGDPTDPPGKAEEIKDDQKQKDYSKDKFGDLAVENTLSGADHSVCRQHATSVEHKEITVREGSEGQCCKSEVFHLESTKL